MNLTLKSINWAYISRKICAMRNYGLLKRSVKLALPIEHSRRSVCMCIFLDKAAGHDKIWSMSFWPVWEKKTSTDFLHVKVEILSSDFIEKNNMKKYQRLFVLNTKLPIQWQWLCSLPKWFEQAM